MGNMHTAFIASGIMSEKESFNRVIVDAFTSTIRGASFSIYFHIIRTELSGS
jgi:hypothetical protein